VSQNRQFSSDIQPAPQSRTGGLILRQAEPLNLEGPFAALNGRVTPNEQFYVRSHFPVPALDAATFRLRVDGAVDRELLLSLDELKHLPAVTREATLECAGNGRIYLTPPAEGVQWELGAVGNAEWTGARLSDLLERSGVRPEAAEFLLEGADRGIAKQTPAPPGEIAYARSLPLAEADRVLLAYAMNGEPLSPDHGFPLRAIVSGHYAMASVKWLTRIHLATHPFQGYFQTTDYAFWDEEEGHPVRRPLREMALKSSIARPEAGAVLEAGSVVTIAGAAWSGGPPLDRVDVSTDGGATWAAAQFLDPEQPGVWRRWQYAWHVPAAGEYVLVSRATDAAGHVQPGEHDERFGAYVIHHIVRAPVAAR
jgi:DMSO/TMAO reductase YedYZ molybdopterin-dependent catalytic subunit